MSRCQQYGIWCLQHQIISYFDNYYGGPPHRLAMLQLVLRKQFDKLEKELIHCLNIIVFVNSIVGHSTFLMYDWKRKVNHSLIKTPLIFF
jgi:hypothetical protein